MITILFISDDTRVADLIARFQPKLRARMRLALDFDQGLKEVFDNRPSAVFIQGDISGISGETVARHIKTLLRADAPRVVLIHTSPLPVQETKKWFDCAVDFSLPQNELVEQFKLRLMEIAPGQWLEKNEARPLSTENASVTNAEDNATPLSPHPGEIEPFDWEAPRNAVTPPFQSSPFQAAPDDAGGEESAPATEVPLNLVGRGVGIDEPGVSSQEPELRGVMPSIIEESTTTQSAFSEEFPSSSNNIPSPPSSASSPKPLLREVEAKPAPSPQPSPAPGVGAFDVPPPASMVDFRAESPNGGKAEWVTIPPPDEGFVGAKRERLTLWASAIVLLIVGVVVGGALLLKSEGRKKKTVPKPAAKLAAPSRTVSAPAPSPKTAPAVGLPSFIPAAGKDQGYGKTNPGWERYRSEGVEYRLFREQGRLKAVQVIALRGKTIPETLVTAVVKELMGSESPAVLSSRKKGGYQRQTGRVAGKGEVVIYRKGGGIRGVVVTLG